MVKIVLFKILKFKLVLKDANQAKADFAAKEAKKMAELERKLNSDKLINNGPDESGFVYG